MADFNDYKWYNDDYVQERKPSEQPVFYTQTHSPAPKKSKKKMFFSALAGLMAGVILSVGGFAGYQHFVPKSNLAFPNSSQASVDKNTSFSFTQLSEGERQPLSVVEIARNVGPAVVGIVSKTKYNSFFGPTFQEGSGSGIILSADGFIVTNNHVVEGASDVNVVLNTGKEYSAKLVGADARSDLAVIKIDEKNLTVATLGSSEKLQVGELAVAIGNPLGQELAGSVTVGVISAVNRTIKTEGNIFTLVQTDAAINPGNSGGALVNGYGEVVGINTMKFSGSGLEGLGFAIPIDEAKPIVDDLMQSGYVKGRPLIGISVQEITAEIALRNDLPIGLYVVEVAALSAADRAGIKKGDVIIKVAGQKIQTTAELNKIRDTHKVGDEIDFEVDRAGQRMNFKLKLQEDKSALQAADRNAEG